MPQKPSIRDVLSVPWTRSMDSTWELVNGAGSRHTPSQIYWIRTSILTKSRADPNTHQGMRNTALEEFWWSCSRWGNDKESSPTSRTQVFRLWTTWMPIIRGVCFKKNADSWVPIPDSLNQNDQHSCSPAVSYCLSAAVQLHVYTHFWAVMGSFWFTAKLTNPLK